MATFVKMFGVELEGGWDRQPPAADRYVTDGSVNVEGRWRVGEIPSPPFSHVGDLRDFMLENYPDHVGESCGLHVHLSFGDRNPAAIAALADSLDFETFLLGKLAAWGRRRKVQNKAFWKRIRGENTYCGLGYSTEAFLGDGHRYRAVNFCALKKRGTVEIRVLPALQSKKLAVRAVRRVLSIVESYLRMRYTDAMAAAVAEVELDPAAINVSPLDPTKFEVEL